MAYNCNGAFNYEMIYDMPIPYRKFNLLKLNEAKEKEAEEMRKIKKTPSRPTIPKNRKR